MKHIYIYSALLLLFSMGGWSCSDYLDKMPDNRAEIDSEEKIAKLLVSAYPVNDYILITELASDNTDDTGANNPNFDRFTEQLFRWSVVTEKNNEDPGRVWEACYSAIANANQALAAIDEMGKAEDLSAERGEALMARAFSHFILVNLFGQHYSAQHSATDLGIVYMQKAETELAPKYERATVLENYQMIEKDIEDALPLINDALYTIPKYHFNVKAAYTFASRFYLFYQKWDKAIECATKALGGNPAELLRDYAYLASQPRDLRNIATQYVKPSMKANFLLLTAYSNLGVHFGAYYDGSRFNHGNLLAQTETHNQAPWGSYPTNVYDYSRMYYLRPYIYAGNNLDKTLFPRIPYMFEYIDPVQGIGYRRAVYATIKAEEALLNRAEAYIMQEKYTEALADMNIWTANTINGNYAYPELTEQSVQNWAASFDYYTPEQPTPKKKLNPDFISIPEGSLQESLMHCLLYMRRHEFIHEGMRWFDVKRFGIEISRRTVNGMNIVSVDDKMVVRDNRRALQIPQDVIDAGITPNPR